MRRAIVKISCVKISCALLIAGLAIMPLTVHAAPNADEAERVYSAYGDAIYQIQVIDIASGKKTSIGSGFQFNDQGMIATNYHVVAGAVQKPKDNKLEFLHDRGEQGSLKILAVDVVHDLAIVQMEKPGKATLKLGTSRLPKGARLFSLGNPHDIGFTIVEGTYNGLSRESFIDKIHFSGALNPGMSGGPAMSHDGRVVGINVATAGNQIGFLVPVEPLYDLMKEYNDKKNSLDLSKNADGTIEKQLLKIQEESIKTLLDKKWETVEFGGMSLPGRIDPVFKCWGAAAHQEKDLYTFYRSTCSSQENIYLDENFTTGTYVYRYDAISARRGLNTVRFYNLYEQQYDTPLDEYTNAGEENVSNFDCNSRFVKTADHLWKASYCLRRYEKYPALYDMHLYLARLDTGDKGLLISVGAQGVSKENALAFATKFMNEIQPAKKEDVK